MTDNLTPLHSVPFKLRIMRMLTAALFMVPVIVMFFQLRGVDMALFMVTQALFRAGVIVLEVPTGYLADTWSRRKVLIVGTVFYAAGLAVMLVAYGFWMMVGAELLMAVGCVMYSGTVQALLYDALAATGQRHKAREELGKQRLYERLTEGASMVVGGLLFKISPILPVVLTLVCFIAALGVLATLPEPPRKIRKAEGSRVKDLFSVVRYSLHGHPELKWLMVYPALLMGMTIVPFWSAQKLMTDYGIEPEVFGIMLMVNFVISGFSARYAENLEGMLGLRRVTWLLLPVIVSGFMVLALVQHPIAFVGMIICAASWSLGSIIFTDLVSRLIDAHADDGDASDIRATVLSVFGLVQQIYGMIGLLLAGWLSPLIGLQQTLLLLGGIVALFALIPMVKVMRLKCLD